MVAPLFSLSFLFIAQANQPDLVHALQTGTLQEREGALKQILEIPPGERSEQLWLALAAQLEAERAFVHQDLDTFRATGKTALPPGESYSGYLDPLMDAVSQWHDTRALPALVASASSGSNIIEPIVQFGEAAVAPLIAAARQGHFSEQDSVLWALQILLEGQSDIAPGGVLSPLGRIPPAPLSPQSRQQIRDLARDLLKPRVVPLPTITWPAVSCLALATGDPDLRQQVQMLADLPSELSNTTGITDANQLVQVQNSIRAALGEPRVK
jgi:hypothetical protein